MNKQAHIVFRWLPMVMACLGCAVGVLGVFLPRVEGVRNVALMEKGVYTDLIVNEVASEYLAGSDWPEKYLLQCRISNEWPFEPEGGITENLLSAFSHNSSTAQKKRAEVVAACFRPTDKLLNFVASVIRETDKYSDRECTDLFNMLLSVKVELPIVFWQDSSHLIAWLRPDVIEEYDLAVNAYLSGFNSTYVRAVRAAIDERLQQ